MTNTEKIRTAEKLFRMCRRTFCQGLVVALRSHGYRAETFNRNCHAAWTSDWAPGIHSATVKVYDGPNRRSSDSPHILRIAVNHSGICPPQSLCRRLDTPFTPSRPPNYTPPSLEFSLLPDEIHQYQAWIACWIIAFDRRAKDLLPPPPTSLGNWNQSDCLTMRYEWTQAAHDIYTQFTRSRQALKNWRLVRKHLRDIPSFLEQVIQDVHDQEPLAVSALRDWIEENNGQLFPAIPLRW